MSAFISEGTQFVDTGGQPLVGGFVYIGLVNSDPKISPITIFSDRELTVVLANPQTLDASGRTVNKIWIPARYSLKVEDLNNVQVFQELDNGEDVGSQTLSLSNVLGTNAITADATPTITSLKDTAQFVLQIVSENTTDAVTLKIDGTAVTTIKRNFDADIGKGKFKVGQTVIVVYNLGQDIFEWTNNNQSVFLDTQVSIAAAATIDLAIADGNSVSVTGHAGPITALGTVLAGAVFKLIYAGSTPVTISTSSIANPTNILCAAAHGLVSGDIVLIEGHSGAIPDINGHHVITLVDSTNYTIPINVTTGGTGGTSTGVPSMTHNATSMILTGANDRTFNPGDTQEVISLGSGNWREFNYQPVNGNVPTGKISSYIGLIAPQGYVMAKGGTIGDDGSGGTERANPDALALYTLLYDSMADAQAPVSTGRGASAAADFAAGKTITIPDLQGKVAVGTGGTAPATHGDNAGEETHTLTAAEVPALGIQLQAAGSGGSSNSIRPTGEGDGFDQTINTSTGGGGSHENMPPWVSLNWIIKL